MAAAAAAVVSPTQIANLVEALGCHTNFGGFVLGNAAATEFAATELAESATAMRSIGYWQLPLALASSLSGVRRAAAAGAPLSLYLVSAPPHVGALRAATPAPPPPSPPSPELTKWVQETVNNISAVVHASQTATNAMHTPGTAIDACSTDSGSLLRFVAYSSVLLGSQALWWEGMGACAPTGSPKFKLIGAINNRISQFADPLFMRLTVGDITGTTVIARYAVKSIWSTASSAAPSSSPPAFGTDASGIRWPPTRGINNTLVTARAPGAGGESDLIQKMSDNVVAVQLVNTTNVGSGQQQSYILFLSTVLSSEKEAGAANRRIAIEMRKDIASIQPVEPDAYVQPTL